MTKQEILSALQKNEISVEDAGKELAKLENGGALRCKVSEKGALSVYGLQRMPVTLYVGQWERLLDFADNIREFAKANEDKLSRKENGNGKDKS
jgi:hypothetical protein